MTSTRARFGWIALTSLLVLLAWDASGLDMALARWAGGPGGFPLRDHWLLTRVLHDGAKTMAWVFTLVLCLGVVWPLGPFQRLPFSRRLQLPVTALLASAVISALKGANSTSCPWEMAAFGGVAQHLSHWSGWFMPDGGSGRCFPAGHATSGFAFVGGFFALRRHLPRLAVVWLLGALVAGLLLGLVQQLRGAHFMSHTLWTAWICWMVGWLADPLFAREATRQVQST
ncbi:MAG: phosphatase PAP2 family protein [Burkholderiaceae bacterium]